jgi:acyl-CoA dehydrogenase
MSTLGMFGEAGAKIFARGSASLGFDEAMWSAVEEAEFCRLLVSENDGGAGDAFAEATALCRSLGQHAAVIPLVETLVSNWCLSKAGIPVSAGPKGFVVADHISLCSSGSQLRVEAITQVPWAGLAGGVVFLLPNAGRGAAICHAEIPSGPAAARTLAGYPVATLIPGDTVDIREMGSFREHRSGLALAALLKAGAMAGAMQTILKMSIDYANTRKQFGRTIGSFQAIQHMVVRIASETAAVDVAVEHGVATFPENPVWGASLAKGRASEAAGHISAAAHQLHGAIGYTHEFSLHRFTRNLWTWREEYGNENAWYGRIGDAALSSEGQVWSRLSSIGLLL